MTDVEKPLKFIKVCCNEDLLQIGDKPGRLQVDFPFEVTLTELSCPNIVGVRIPSSTSLDKVALRATANAIRALLPERPINEWLDYIAAKANLLEAGVPEKVGNLTLSMWDRILYYRSMMAQPGVVADTRGMPIKAAITLAVESAAPDPEPPPFILTNCQEKAWAKLQAFVESDEPYFLLRGYSGTGKTTLLQMLQSLNKYNIAYTAPTNKAAKVISKMLNVRAKTVYSFLGIRMEHEDDSVVLTYPDRLPKGFDNYILVVDECSMVGEQLLEFIKRAAAEMGIKVIFVGDPAQLRPVGEIRSPVWNITKNPKCRSLLTEVKRYDDQLLVLATALRNTIRYKTFDEFNIRDFVDGKQVRMLSQREFEARMCKNISTHRVIAWRNKTVDGYNNVIRASLGFEEDYCVGDQLLLAAPMQDEDGNIMGSVDDELEVLHADMGSVKVGTFSVEVWKLSCSSDDDTVVLNIATPRGLKQLSPILGNLAAVARKVKGYKAKSAWEEFWKVKNMFHKVRYGFALTSHRAQGSTIRRVFVDRQDILANREVLEAYQCLYVASSRASERVYSN